MSLTVPTIHSNGTGRKALLKQYQKAMEALERAIEAVGETAPHGRDYYPQGQNALPRAQEEHRNRMLRLYETTGELRQIAEHIADQ